MAKHHDGFCMFDTRTTDYKITDAKTPFSKDPRSNVTQEILNAFRKEGMMPGIYFSKPDWHAPDYWWSYFPPKDRNPTYDTKKYPEIWKRFKDFTYTQFEELMSNYGKVDLLWLDGGWVRPFSSIDSSVSWQKSIPYDQDIDMPKIAAMARSYQPGLLIVDRTVTGEYENYTTPEQQVPDKPLPFPWETCMTMGGSWSYVPGDQYKSATELIHLLVKIVSRGGNFLLNIGPGPDGDWDPEAYKRLEEIGAWMQLNGEGIFNSRPVAPYSDRNIFFTRSKDEKTSYAFCLSDSTGKWPASVRLPASLSAVNYQYRLTGSSSRLKTSLSGNQVIVYLPADLLKKQPRSHALVIRISNK
jgi:alpha-L-fucosidase